jgi:hypothetical protein
MNQMVVQQEDDEPRDRDSIHKPDPVIKTWRAKASHRLSRQSLTGTTNQSGNQCSWKTGRPKVAEPTAFFRANFAQPLARKEC